MEREKIEYRHSDSKDFNKISMPGMVKNNNITLKRGKFEGDFDYNTWLDEIANERVDRSARCDHQAAERKTRACGSLVGNPLLSGKGHGPRS